VFTGIINFQKAASQGFPLFGFFNGSLGLNNRKRGQIMINDYLFI
jgi:hypothetical protein